MFSDVITAFYSLVPTNSTLYGMKIVPSDFKGKAAPPYARLHFVFAPTRYVATNGSKEVRGLAKLTIFNKSGQGDKFFADKAAQLDEVFQGQMLSNYIQTYTSSLQLLGPDTADSTLSRADYSVPFSYYGE